MAHPLAALAPRLSATGGVSGWKPSQRSPLQAPLLVRTAWIQQVCPPVRYPLPMLLRLTANIAAQLLGIILAHRVTLPARRIVDIHSAVILWAVIVLLSTTPNPLLAPVETGPRSHQLPANTFRGRPLLAAPALVLPGLCLRPAPSRALVGSQHRLAAVLTAVHLLIQLAAH